MIQPFNTLPKRTDNRGVALLTALGLLLIFAMLGTTYVGYMSIEVAETRYDMHDARSKQLSAAGIQAAIGEIQNALANSNTPTGTYEFELAVYRTEGGERIAHPQTVKVKIADESRLINLNHAPSSLLIAVGMDENHVAALKNSLPGSGASNRWLSSVDELRTRDNLMDGREFNALNKNSFTVFTAANADRPEGYMNLNTVSPVTLAAIFAIDVPEAEALAAKRPFNNWEGLVAAIGREPATFNVSNREYASRSMPPEFAFSSRCYRLVSEVTMVVTPGTTRNGLHRAVEAVVLFDDDGTPSIRFWTEQPLESYEENVPAPSVEPAQAEETEPTEEPPATE